MMVASLGCWQSFYIEPSTIQGARGEPYYPFTEMSESFRRGKVRCASPTGFHSVAYREWGSPDNPRVLVCVHGLTRSARDFDYLARALCTHYRVVCPDLPGRGNSDWLRNPVEYQVPLYAG